MIDFKDEAKKSGNFFLYQIIASELLSFNCSYEEQANVLPSSPKILQVNERDFSQLNFLDSN